MSEFKVEDLPALGFPTSPINGSRGMLRRGVVSRSTEKFGGAASDVAKRRKVSSSSGINVGNLRT